jgi:hypothetical protein
LKIKAQISFFEKFIADKKSYYNQKKRPARGQNRASHEKNGETGKERAKSERYEQGKPNIFFSEHLKARKPVMRNIQKNNRERGDKEPAEKN